MANFICYKDFNINNLTVCECKENKQFKFKTMEIKYVYPNGEESGLRIRSPSLFSHGVAKYRSNPSYFMSLVPVYDLENPTEKEIAFKETLNSISRFLRNEWEKANRRRDSSSENLEIIKDNIFFPRLKEKKIYENNIHKECEIETRFYEIEFNGDPTPRDPKSYEEGKCKVVAFIDIDDISYKGTILKIRTSISDVIIAKKHVCAPPKYRRPFISIEDINLGSDDE